jgi:hypothetical protein
MVTFNHGIPVINVSTNAKYLLSLLIEFLLGFGDNQPLNPFTHQNNEKT